MLRPLYDTMVSQVLQSAWLHTDDTSVKNQGHEPGTTALSRFWIYWGDRTHPYNVFDFTINRKRDGPQTFPPARGPGPCSEWGQHGLQIERNAF